MKKIATLLIATMLYSTVSISQERLSEIEKLATTAKVWGFLKYYHPEVADGKFNWDEQLFEVLPKVKTATNKTELSQIYIDWIESLGTIKPCKKCGSKKSVQYFDKNFNLSWLSNNHLFTTELSEKLTYIEQNRHQGNKHYVAYYDGEPKAIYIDNEIDYKGFDWQDENLRILSLFRFWNIIEYFFPAKYQMNSNWDTVLNNMIPKFLNSKSETDLHLAMLELVVSIDDSHVKLNSTKTYNFFSKYVLPIKYKLINSKAIVTGIYNDSLAKLDDLKVGDIITKADDKTIDAIFHEQEKYISGSNISRKKLNAKYFTLRGPSNSLKIEVTRGGKTDTKIVKRYLYKDFNYKEKETEKHKILEGNIGYIDIGKVTVEEVPEIMDKLTNTQAIIFDMRKSSGLALYSFANYITSQSRDFYKAIYQDLNYPGKFIWTKTRQSGNNKLKYTGKVILLVDENSQSQREFTAMCLQVGDDVTTIGRQTSGADGNVVRFNMVGGYKTQISGIGIFYPDGTETQRKGVKIDIEVQPTVQGIVEGKDEILDKAIEFINKSN